MTAIAGILQFKGNPDSVERCARMLAAQKTYGAHAKAEWSDNSIAVGWCQMRLLPEDVHDRQPLVGGGGRYVLVADIRLDNRDDLIRDLAFTSERARKFSDAMILLSTIERWGENCLDHIIGEYAFALWDCKTRRLLLVRDPLGMRPLHFHHGKDFFAFASMPVGLHALPEITVEPSELRIATDLLYVPGNDWQSFFEGISRVQAGHLFAITKDGTNTRRHWQLKRSVVRFRSDGEYLEAAREILDRAVRCRLRGAGDIAAHLSGGLDSSGVAATAARLLAPSGRKVIAFTAAPREGFSDGAPAAYFTDETRHAAEVAALYPNMEHVVIRNEKRPLFDDFDRTYFLFGEPAGSPSNLGWNCAINDSVRKRGLKILLTGQTGNYGLSYEGTTLLPELLRGGSWVRLWKEAKAFMHNSGVSYRMALALTFGPWCPLPLWILFNRLRGHNYSDVRKSMALNPAYLSALNSNLRASVDANLLDGRPEKDGFAFRERVLTRGWDLGNVYKGILGGWQIDIRDPTADVRLLQFCASIPTGKFMVSGVRRAFARSVLADRLPKLLLDEHRTGIQAADWFEHLTENRTQIVAELDRLEQCPLAERLLDLPRLRKLVDSWDDDRGWEKQGHEFRVYVLTALATGHFLRRATGSNA